MPPHLGSERAWTNQRVRDDPPHVFLFVVLEQPVKKGPRFANTYNLFYSLGFFMQICKPGEGGGRRRTTASVPSTSASSPLFTHNREDEKFPHATVLVTWVHVANGSAETFTTPTTIWLKWRSRFLKHVQKEDLHGMSVTILHTVITPEIVLRAGARDSPQITLPFAASGGSGVWAPQFFQSRW